MVTIGTLFTGFGGIEIGARAAGLELAWGVELDPAIAEVANANLGRHVLVADVLSLDPRVLELVDVLYASPECQRASIANVNKGETALDLALGRRIELFVETLLPRVFTLENVGGYRHFKAFKGIVAALFRLGYFVHFDLLNAADFGVPQTRRRLILRAVRGGLVPMLPAPELLWRGWYQAIEDLIPTLPESRFAPWQLARLPEMPGYSCLLSQGVSHDQKGNEYPAMYYEAGEPSPTVTGNGNQSSIKAFMLGGQFGQPANDTGEARPAQLVTGDSPVFTVTAVNKGDWRAFLVYGTKTDTTPGGEPAATVVATAHSKSAKPRAWLSTGRVVSMTPRCLARFQTFPDWYELPTASGLACKGIGNAVPPLWYEKLVKSLFTQ